MIDATLFTKEKENELLIVKIYVDHIIFGSTNESLCEEFFKVMKGEFKMNLMGELNYLLGLQIKQYHEGIFINQAKYTRDLLKRFGMDNSKPMGTPMSPSTQKKNNEKGKDVDQTKYRGMIDSLLYLTASKLDIMFSICV